MTPVKTQSSSRRKGKEIISNVPAAHNEGEEVVHFESDSSDEEEARRAPDSECTL